MKLREQVITVEQAKRLKELGITQKKSLFYFYEEIVNGKTSFPIKPLTVISESCNNERNEAVWQSIIGREKNVAYAAFTVAELSAMLPTHYPSWRFPIPGQEAEKWIATVICAPRPLGIDDIHTAHEFDRMGDTQAQALGTLLIALLVTEVITPEETNTRLSK